MGVFPRGNPTGVIVLPHSSCVIGYSSRTMLHWNIEEKSLCADKNINSLMLRVNPGTDLMKVSDSGVEQQGTSRMTFGTALRWKFEEKEKICHRADKSLILVIRVYPGYDRVSVKTNVSQKNNGGVCPECHMGICLYCI